MVFNATFNNSSVISWQFYCWRKQQYPEKTTTKWMGCVVSEDTHDEDSKSTFHL
jgi:hypothetical protein